MDQLREVLRVKHYATRIERASCDWVKRYVGFHRMRAREDLFPGAEKVELLLKQESAQATPKPTQSHPKAC